MGMHTISIRAVMHLSSLCNFNKVRRCKENTMYLFVIIGMIPYCVCVVKCQNEVHDMNCSSLDGEGTKREEKGSKPETFLTDYFNKSDKRSAVSCIPQAHLFPLKRYKQPSLLHLVLVLHQSLH